LVSRSRRGTLGALRDLRQNGINAKTPPELTLTMTKPRRRSRNRIIGIESLPGHGRGSAQLIAYGEKRTRSKSMAGTRWRQALAPLMIAILTGIDCGSRTDAAAPGPIASEQAMPELITVVRGLEHPWGMAFMPGGDILVTERAGRLRIIRDGLLDPAPIEGVPPVYASGQGGLLDVALDPEFASNRVIYLSYAATGDGGLSIDHVFDELKGLVRGHGQNSTRVARATLGDGRLEHLEVIFTAEPLVRSESHFGSRLVFDPDGYLLITVGERGQGNRAQDLADDNGSVIRLHPDGRVPQDNPFAGVAGARREIFSYGHRNPQGLAIHPETGIPWLHEHGPQGGDEVNVVRPGVNYGWPVITYGLKYSGASIGKGTHKEGMAQPIHYWVPSIAPSGMVFYDGRAFPQWRGDLLIGALRGQALVRLELDGERVVGEERLLEGAIGRIRDVEVGPEGYVYLLTDESDGGLYRLEPAERRRGDG
jgi:glucose/arabinose dehydrogenase